MKDFKEKFKDRYIWLWMGCGLFWAIIHCLIRINVGDDVNFYATSWETYSFSDYFHLVYDEYSSRIFMWYLNSFLSGHSHIYWRLLDTVCFVLTTYLTVNILDVWGDLKKTLLIMVSYAALPVHFLASAGWIATTVDYTWPTCCALYYLYIILKLMRGRRVPVWEYIVSFFMLVYGCDMEQLNIIVLGISAWALVYGIILKNKKVISYSASGLVVCAIILVFVLTCPGNSSRGWIGETFDFTGFELFGMSTKIYLGFTNTWDSLIRESLNVLTLWFVTLTAVRVFKNNNGVIVKCISLVPVAFCIASIGAYFYYLVTGNRLYPEQTAIINLFNMYEERAYLRMMVYFFVSGCIFASAYCAFEKPKEKVIVLGLLFLGCGVAIASGLSASVHISFYRTNTYLAIILSELSAYMCFSLEKKWQKWLFICLPITALLVLNVINFIGFYLNAYVYI